MDTPGAGLRTRIQWAGLPAGPALAALAYALLPVGPDGLTHAGRAAAAVGVWMAVWWLTEAIEVFVTALLPLALLPLTGVASPAAAAAPYAHELIFLFLGGFVLALSMQRWGLDQRVALITLRIVGSRPANLVGGVMIATAAMSMWVSNTATAAMMLPITISLIHRTLRVSRDAVAEGEIDPAARNFAVCMLLGLAYGASIGGVGTIIGSPPNLFAASYLRENLGVDVTFVEWLAFGLPFVAVLLPIAWLLLTRVLYPVRRVVLAEGTGFTREAYRALGPVKRGEWATFVVFALTASAWVTRPLLARIEIGGATPLAGLADSSIAIVAAIALFLIPVDVGRRRFVMEWSTAKSLPWGVLILVGGGLSLATALEANGVSDWLGGLVRGAGILPTVAFVLLVATLVIFLTELTSNTATAAVLIPILAGVGPALGVDAVLLVVPVAIAASAAFMLPVATPPNAIVFASGLIRVPDMARAGFLLNLLSALLVTSVTLTLVPLVLG